MTEKYSSGEIISPETPGINPYHYKEFSCDELKKEMEEIFKNAGR